MQLKLAEYNIKEFPDCDCLECKELNPYKFERFLECGDALGSEFSFCGNSVKIFYNKIGGYFQYFKDKKDPLNRFNGLFDSRIYGGGRFVLVEGDDFQFFKSEYRGDRFAYENPDIFISFQGELAKRNNAGWFWRYDFPSLNPNECVGNIFENPELWEKVK